MERTVERFMLQFTLRILPEASLVVTFPAEYHGAAFQISRTLPADETGEIS